jgi:hypothetical protein
MIFKILKTLNLRNTTLNMNYLFFKLNRIKIYEITSYGKLWQHNRKRPS